MSKLTLTSFTATTLLAGATALAAPGDVVTSFAAPQRGIDAISWSPSGDLWGRGALISGEPNTFNKMYRINPADGSVLSSHDWVDNAGIEFGGSNYYTTRRSGADNLALYNQSGTFQSSVNFSVSTVLTTGIAYDGAGNIYYASITNKGLYRVAASTGVVTFVATIEAPDAQLFDVAWDGAALWVTGSNGDSLYRVDPTNGGILASITVAWSLPDVSGVAWDGNCLWIIDTDRAMIYKMDHGEASLPQCVAGPITDAGIDAPSPVDAGVIDGGGSSVDGGSTDGGGGSTDGGGGSGDGGSGNGDGGSGNGDDGGGGGDSPSSGCCSAGDSGTASVLMSLAVGLLLLAPRRRRGPASKSI
jgi:hypothetical protein